MKMLIKQNGNLRKRHYTHIFMRCQKLYILHICTCTCILDVSRRGVLDRRMTILHFFCIFCQFLSSCSVLLFMRMFFWQIPAYSTYLKYDIAFFCILCHCLLFMESFVCNLHAYSAYLQYHIYGRHGTVEKCIKHFGF